jgi:RHS repeat-associated protein
MHKKTFLLASLLLFYRFAFLLAGEIDLGHHTDQSVELTEGIPSNIINNTVSVISGEYIDSCVDITLQGPRPLVYARTYSSFIEDGTFFRSWNDNQRSFVDSYDAEHEKKKVHALTLKQAHGSNFTYKRSRSKEKDPYELILPKGLTNGSTSLSAKTHIRNTKMEYDKKKKEIYMRSGDGNVKTYVRNKSADKEKKNISEYLLESDKNTRDQIVYYKKNAIEGMLTGSVETKGKNSGKVYSELTFKKNSDFKNHPSILLSTTDGRTITYKFKRHNKVVETPAKPGKDINGFENQPGEELIRGYYLDEVIKSHGPTEKYEYAKKESDDLLHITCKSLPKNRFLKTSYYERGENEVGGQIGKLSLHKYDYRIDRVKKQKAPTGIDETPITIYRFDYHAELKNGHDLKNAKVLEGSTDVYDAHDHKSIYEYNKRHRLKRILRFTGNTNNNYSNYSFERFFWGREGTFNEGNLTTKYLVDWKNFQIHHGYHFFYDDAGNTKLKILFGKLTGNPAPALILDTNNLPLENGYEREETYYTYSDDNLNLLLSEKQSNGKNTIYQYKKGTDLIQSKFVEYDDKIQLREFYYYDVDHVLIKKISDNGQGLDEGDGTDVSRKFITYYHPQDKIPYGLYGSIEEKYYDFNTGEEVLLKRMENEFSIQGQLLTQKTYDALGHFAFETSYGYDEQGNLIKEVNPLKETITRKYDENNNLTRQKGPFPGYSVKNFYDFSNRLVKKQETHSDNNCFVTTYKYDYLNQLVSSRNPFGNETFYTYDDVGHLISVKNPGILTASGKFECPTINKEYDIAGQVTSIQDALGRKTFYENNIRGKPLIITYPDGTQEKFFYRLDGQLTQKINREGIKIVYTLDPVGRPLKEEMFGSDGHLEKFIQRTYDAFSLISEEYSDGMTINYSYDFAGRLKQLHHNKILTKELFYDPLGRESRTHDWYDFLHYKVTLKKYDLLNRITEERTETQEGQLLELRAFEYDCLGNKTMVRVGDQTTYASYNSYKQPTKIVDALGNETNIFYNTAFLNEHGQYVLEKITTDPLGNQTFELYDALSRLIRTTRKNAVNKILSDQKIFYDLCGNCIRIEDAVIYADAVEKTVTALYDYDLCDRKTLFVEALGTPEQKQISYKYNQKGQKEALIKSDGVQLIYAYDPIGRLKRFTSSDDSIHYIYEYDQKDHLTRIEDIKNNAINTRTYNLFGQLTEEIFGNGLKVAFTCDLFDRNTLVTLPDQTQIEYIYDPLHLKEIHRVVNRQRLYSQYNVDYNSAGIIERELRPGEVGGQSYQYDALNRCKALHAHSLVQHIPSDGFDPVGNLRKYSTNDKASHFEYDDLYQMVSEKGEAHHRYAYDSLCNRRLKDEAAHDVNHLNQVLKAGTDQYGYDRNGNLCKAVTSKGEVLYSYDALDRLISVEKNGIKTTYTYDSFNRRLSKKTENNATIYYLYQDIEEIGSWENHQIKELKILNKDHRKSVAIELNGIPYVPIQDLFGHVVKLLDLEGNLFESYRYSSFGEVEIFDEYDQVKNTSLNPWLYSNRRLDAESGLFVFSLRYYDPQLGRWISPDPAGAEDGPNLYAHVHNNPLKYFDLLGLMASEHDYSIASDMNAATLSGISFIGTIYNLVSSLFTNPDPGDASGIYSINSMLNPETGKRFNYPSNNQRIIITGTGIYTTYDSFNKNLMYISELINYNVRGVFNQTEGLLWDCHKYKLSHHYGYLSEGMDYWMRQLSYCHEHFPDAEILALPHSRSCTELRNALIELPEIRNKVSILAIAPGSYFEKNLCKKVIHLVCKGDVVPMLDINRHLHRDSTIFLECSDYFPKNHYLDHPVYAPYIKGYSQGFLENGHL